MIKKKSSLFARFTNPLEPFSPVHWRAPSLHGPGATRVYIRACVDRFYRNATLQREVEQFAQQTGAFGLFIKTSSRLSKFRSHPFFFFFSHPFPGGDRFYRDTNCTSIFYLSNLLSSFFSLSLSPIDIS